MTSGKVYEQKAFRLLRYLGAYPIYSQNPKPALKYTHRLLEENLAVIIAPQGRRIPSNPIEDYHNLLRDAKSGVGRVILNINGRVPVVPVYIHGSKEALAIGSIIPKMKSYISISICKPILFTDFQREEGWADSDPEFYTTAREISKQIMSAIKEQMLVQERYFFQIIRKKINIPLEKLFISPETNFKAHQVITKLLHYSPDELKQLITFPKDDIRIT
jgi:1-acyl-sn-glycerol-3-phosphate acyltransferase